jgi:hypothetical protein
MSYKANKGLKPLTPEIDVDQMGISLVTSAVFLKAK